MKKLVDFFKNFAGVIKAIRFVAECLESFANIYQKYYPSDKVVNEVKEEVSKEEQK